MYELLTRQKNRGHPVTQSKLKVGRPGDKYEQEADRVADRVMRMGNNKSVQMQPIAEEKIGLMPKLRMQPLEEEEDKISIQPKLRMSGINVREDLNNELNAAKGNGNSMALHTNRFMSRVFGADFSDVDIHTGRKAIQMNQQLGARAFTYGSNIFFNKGEYNPESNTGKNLLAHELTHVLQQRDNVIQKTPTDTDPPRIDTRYGLVQQSILLSVSSLRIVTKYVQLKII